jgi:hypothetical protein
MSITDRGWLPVAEVDRNAVIACELMTVSSFHMSDIDH